MSDGLPDDYADRLDSVNAFIRCDDCGSESATAEVQNGNIRDPTVPVKLRATCPECGKTTDWVPL